MARYSFLVWVILSFNVTVAFGQTHDSHSKPEEAHNHDMVMEMNNSASVAVTEKIGSSVPLDIELRDTSGTPVFLRDIIDRPTVLLPVYYNCPGVCGLLMSSLAMAIRRMSGVSWDEYRVITFSFDAEDTPEMARNAKASYLNLLGDDYPAENWRFLVTDQSNIDRLLDATGYHVIKQKQHLFAHPNVLMVLSDEGVIVRYIYGPRFLPFDVGMAISEAASGKLGVSVKKVLSYCFSYDTEEKRYVFQYIRVFGLLIPLLLLLFYFIFLRPGNQSQK